MIAVLFGRQGFWYWRDAFTPLTIRRWREEQRGILNVTWSGWTLTRCFGFRVALIHKEPW